MYSYKGIDEKLRGEKKNLFVKGNRQEVGVVKKGFSLRAHPIYRVGAHTLSQTEPQPQPWATLLF